MGIMFSLGAQVVGLAAVVMAVWMLAGLPWALLVGGVVLVGVGTLAEGGKL